MTSVLLTRPVTMAHDTASELANRGYQVALAPLLTIAPTLENQPTGIIPPQAVMITSSNALSVPLATDLGPLLTLPCFCVGTQTAEKAKNYGFQKVINADGDGVDLARLITGMLADHRAPILHIAGRHISPTVRTNLAVSGYHLLIWSVYQATPITVLPDETLALIRKELLDVVMVYSSRTADTLCQLIRLHKLEACCTRLITIGLSPSIRDILSRLPWKQCAVASVPTESAMIACLNEFRPLP